MCDTKWWYYSESRKIDYLQVLGALGTNSGHPSVQATEITRNSINYISSNKLFGQTAKKVLYVTLTCSRHHTNDWMAIYYILVKCHPITWNIWLKHTQ